MEFTSICANGLYYAVILTGVCRLTYWLFRVIDIIERPRKRGRR